MNIWNKLANIHIENKEKYKKIFSQTVKKIRERKYDLQIGETEKDDHYIIIEDKRMNSYFVHVVPKGAYSLFKEMQEKIPQSFLGFTVVAGKQNNKDIRVSCFGIDCSSLGKSLFKG
ncbi:hypothetical protein HYS50_02025 [Candidatus Woesearchaeota archaeon]|nr:hypothetical protein [Candidatus Woesearchaeota archaeon]